MNLQKSIKKHGMVDHYDFCSGKKYELSKAKDNGSTYTVPVTCQGILTGYIEVVKQHDTF